MSRIYVSGPAYVWTGTGTSFAWQYFGFTERGLTVTLSGIYEDVPVDYAGAMPADVSMLGQEAVAGGTFSRYNESVLQTIMSFGAVQPLNLNIPGLGADFNAVLNGQAQSSVGTLMASEGGAYPLLLFSPYSFKSEFGDMIPGFWFYNAYVPERIPQVLSVRHKAPEISWRSIPIFGAVTGSPPNQVFTAGAPYSAYQLYTTTMPSNLSTLLALVN
jgi:hypothetical protein